MNTLMAFLSLLAKESERARILSVTPYYADITQTISGASSFFSNDFTISTSFLIFDGEFKTEPPNFITILILSDYILRHTRVLGEYIQTMI